MCTLPGTVLGDFSAFIAKVIFSTKPFIPSSKMKSPSFDPKLIETVFYRLSITSRYLCNGYLGSPFLQILS